jgi:hypothetical protein
MCFDDSSRPYSFELRGDLEEYLRQRDEMGADNLFFGSDHFFEIKEKGFMMLGLTWIRVDQSPIPDLAYSVNSDYMLESRGSGHQNMSLMGAEEGVYNPREVLKDKLWSIYLLKI